MVYKDKQSVVNAIPTYLQLFDEDVEYLENIDERLITYISDVLNTPDSHNKYEILGVFRFLDFFDKYSFNVSKYKKFVRFYEALPFVAENTGAVSFKLTPIQAFQFANIYGFVKENGCRLCRSALLFVPRKFSKTTSVAACAMWDLMFGPPNAQAFVAANSFKQAHDVCFKIISDALKAIDPSEKSFKRNKDIIYSKLPGKASFLQCLSASPQRLDGLNASTIILDEYAAAPSAALKNVLTSSQGARKEPLVITITTASTVFDGPFASIELANYKKILDGTIENDSVFASIFEPDEGDDIGDPKTWHKVQPHMNITVYEEKYEQDWLEAVVDANKMVEFKTKMLNIFTPPVKANWVEPKVIQRNMIEVDLQNITTRPLCMVSVDLSVRDDISAVCYGLYDAINKSFAFYLDYYIPENTILSHTNSQLYQGWVNAGYLHVCGKEVIDYQQIGKDILNNSKYFNILTINYDSYKNKDLTNFLRANGVKCLQPYKQVYSAFTSPVESFEQGVYEGKMKLADNPVTTWMFSNVVMDSDNMENKKPIKMSASRKIDGVVCILMSLGAFMNYKR